MQPLSPYLVNGASGAALAAKALAIDAGATLDRRVKMWFQMGMRHALSICVIFV